jgi:hypothetical protein
MTAAMFELLKQLLPRRSEDVVQKTPVGRTAQLRQKFASRLAEFSEVRLREPASEEQVERLRELVSPVPLPEEVVELYSTADGEASCGFFVPELEFLRSDYSAKLFQANREALAMGLLPREVEGAIPIFRDSVGNQIVVRSMSTRGEVVFVDMGNATVHAIEASVRSMIRRLVLMKNANDHAGEIVCPGDFRSLTSTELEIASSVGR